MMKISYAKPQINCTYENLQTPLHLAWMSWGHEIIKILVEMKANVNAKNELLKTPLHYASQIEEDMIFSSQSSNGEEPQNLQTVKLLLDAGKF